MVSKFDPVVPNILTGTDKGAGRKDLPDIQRVELAITGNAG